jgi:hypothetical protein
MAAAILADAALRRKPVGHRGPFATKSLRPAGMCDSVAAMAASMPGA